MKKLLILAALAALALGACTKNEVVFDNNDVGDAVSFSVYTSRTVTKADATNVIGIDTLKKYGFGVFAFYTGQDSLKAKTNPAPNFMNNTQVKFESGKWAYSPIKYWPNNPNDKVSFFAYAPYSDTTTWKADSKKIHFEVQKDVKGQTDLLFAKGLTDKTKQGYKDSLKFEFKHALSKIGLKVAYVRDSVSYNADNGKAIEDSTKIVIDTVYLIPADKFYKEGDLDMMKDTVYWTAGSAKIDTLKFIAETNFKHYAAASDSSAAGQVVTNKLDTLNNDNSYMMIIPQDFSTNGINVVVNYHVWTKDQLLTDKYSKIENKVTTKFKPTFLAGKQYFLNLYLGVNSVKIKAEVADWVDGTDSDIYLPQNTEGGSTN